MNANELANEIDKFLQEAEQLPWGTKQVYLDQSATMLRQLQAENESLKKQVIGDDYVFVCKRCGDELGIKFEAQEK